MISTHMPDLWVLVAKYLNEDDEALVCTVLYDPEFQKGAGGASHHHAYSGGLVDHTWEVAVEAIKMAQGEEADALVAAIFHDYGKIHDYKINEDGTVSNQPFSKLIGHLPWSWHFFVNTGEKFGMDEDRIARIGHALLAHHGRHEWRSPVEPQTRLAFALHSADMLSMQKAKRT